MEYDTKMTRDSAISNLNSLPKHTILGMSKFKSSPDDKSGVAEIMGFVFERVAKHCGKRRKCRLPAFSSFPTMFSEGFLPWVVNCVVKCQPLT